MSRPSPRTQAKLERRNPYPPDLTHWDRGLTKRRWAPATHRSTGLSCGRHAILNTTSHAIVITQSTAS